MGSSSLQTETSTLAPTKMANLMAQEDMSGEMAVILRAYSLPGIARAMESFMKRGVYTKVTKLLT